MKLLDRYILRTFVRLCLLTQTAFAGIYLLIDIFERVDDLIEHGAALSSSLLYFAHKIPMIVSQTVPMTILLGTFLTLGSFSRTHELTAMRAGGFSLFRLATPLVAGAVLVVIAVLATNETLLPYHSRRSNEIFEVEIKNNRPEKKSMENLWIREGDRLIHIGMAPPDARELRNVTLFEFGPDFELLARLDAPVVRAQEGGWVAPQTQRRQFRGAGGSLTESETKIDELLPVRQSREAFEKSSPDPEEMGFFELRKLTRRLNREGYDAVRYRVDMHSRLATPFASLIMVLLAVPFSLARGRGSSLAVGVSISIGIGIAYHMIQGLMLAFGYSGALPPLLAAWTPNLVFLLLGCWLMLSRRQ